MIQLRRATRPCLVDSAGLGRAVSLLALERQWLRAAWRRLRWMRASLVAWRIRRGSRAAAEANAVALAEEVVDLRARLQGSEVARVCLEAELAALRARRGDDGALRRRVAELEGWAAWRRAVDRLTH